MWATNLRGRSKTYFKIGSESKGIKGYDKKGNKPDRTYKK